MVFFSLLLVSCQDKRLDVRDYRFDAQVEILDNTGADFIVGQPVKMKLQLLNVKHKAGNKFDFKFTVGDRRGYVYLDGSADTTYAANENISNLFVNDEVVFYYVPQNGGEQTVTFAVSNGDKFAATVDKTMSIGTGAVVEVVAPETLVTDSPDTPVKGKIITRSTLDEDNYFNVVFKILEGEENEPSMTYHINEYASTSIAFGDTVRILSGIDSTAFHYSYFQAGEGKTKIELTVIDRYGNVEQRVYDFCYWMPLVLEITGYSAETVNRATGQYYWLPRWEACNLAYAIVSVKDMEGNPYEVTTPVSVAFKVNYNILKQTYDGIRGHEYSSNVSVNVNPEDGHRNYRIFQNFTNTGYNEQWYFRFALNIELIHVYAADQEQRRYTVKTSSAWQQGKEPLNAGNFDYYNPSLTDKERGSYVIHVN